MIEIGINRLQKLFTDEPVLREVSFDIQSGEKIGIVGVNGSGKSTLFKVITGVESADGGEVYFRKDCRVGYLKQDPVVGEGLTAREVIREAFAELLKKGSELKKLEIKLGNTQGEELTRLMRLYGEMQSEFERAGGYEIEVEISRIASGLQLSDQILSSEFLALSGGEKNRVMLGRILLEAPDVLLLDEPTNHLDIAASEWLESYLSSYSGAAAIISHDRYFLDNAVSRIIELEDGTAKKYAGNYSYYVKERGRRFLAEYENYKNIQKKIKAMKAAAERFRIWGRINTDNNAHMARAKKLEARIEELQQIDRPQMAEKIDRKFKSGRRSGKEVIKAEKMSFSYEEREIFARVDFLLCFGERLGFIGPNGSGKSTLLKLALQELKPDSGMIRLGASIKWGYLEQDIKFEDESVSVLESFRTKYPCLEGEARNVLARYLFRKNDVYKKLELLSGGERVRLRLCFMMQQDLNLLLLDEPTNHLDIESREMVEDALLKFKGTIFFISHDRYFINKIAESLVVLENKGLKRYPGNYEYYHQIKSMLEAKETQTFFKEKPFKEEKNKIKSVNPLIIQKLEAKIEEFETRLAELESDMETHAQDYLRLIELDKEKQVCEKELDMLLQKWEDLLQ